MRTKASRRIWWAALAVVWSIAPAILSAQPRSPALRVISDEAPQPPESDEGGRVEQAAAHEALDSDAKTEPAEPAPLQTPPDAAEPVALDGENDFQDSTPIDAATLGGVQPGVTTREQLHARWKGPLAVEKVAGGVREAFEVDGFKRVRATITDGVVQSVAIQLTRPVRVKWLARELKLDDCEPVELWDDRGQTIGLVYPEHGTMLGLVPRASPPQVQQIVLQPVDADSFLARAEVRLSTRYADCLADLKQVMQLDPANGRAHWLHAQLTYQAGELDEALKSVHKAIDSEPANLEYRLTLAKLQADRGGDAQAVKQLRAIIADSKATPLVLAKAYCQWGDCVAAGLKADFNAATKLHVQAIKLAEPLSTSAKLVVRRAAKQLLVEAHLAVARDVGLGRWQQKSAVLPKWLEKAQRLADDVIARDHGDAQLKLRVYEEALAALVGMTDPPDAAPWIRGATQLGASTLEEAADPGFKARVAWQLAVALADAVEIEATRDRGAQALELGKLALECFEQGDIAGRELPGGDYVRGRLLYRLGALAAVEQADHKAAVAWFDQALACLERPLPPSAAANRGRHGEMLVSMAISYWEVSKCGEALRLTQRGAKLMEQAAAEGQLSRSALAVPYANLATMHEKLGRSGDAKKYSVLAASFQEKAGPAEPPRKMPPKVIQGNPALQ